MELELWQYLSLIFVALTALIFMVKYINGLISKIVSIALWCAISIFLFTQVFRVV